MDGYQYLCNLEGTPVTNQTKKTTAEKLIENTDQIHFIFWRFI